VFIYVENLSNKWINNSIKFAGSANIMCESNHKSNIFVVLFECDYVRVLNLEQNLGHEPHSLLTIFLNSLKKCGFKEAL
jgi:hypothetical protein